ncbi:PREDICTED: NAD(P)H-quinone oxidoreductase subunit L, chloroplastic [Nelumbo nucifera]|uniref:NAD(P)H-quinone oxidoreductase subunit L, chloroplastic n=1 Tax=Nelumbo nucifera TaxID=4432 RepID=A0A1U8B1Y2_NELNU|nr:PREDICTED: NAD(P)H-quinone oxidoreductase subunit L, chloroplastic [Nelumbo nucifera]
MNCSLSSPLAKAVPVCISSQFRRPSLSITSKHVQQPKFKPLKALNSTSEKPINWSALQKSGLALQLGTLLVTIEQPAFAVTGVNDEQDLTTTLIQLGIVAFWYFLIMPPIIMNWLRLRWYKRKLLEMYLQFMFVFMFFPGIILWAPFINFRRLPRDPSMKYPWSTPQDPSFE